MWGWTAKCPTASSLSMSCACSRVLDSGFRFQGIYVIVSGFGFRILGFGFRVSGFGYRSGFGFWVSGFSYRISGFGFQGWIGFRVSVLGFQVSGFGLQFSVLRLRVLNFGFRFDRRAVLLRVDLLYALRSLSVYLGSPFGKPKLFPASILTIFDRAPSMSS